MLRRNRAGVTVQDALEGGAEHRSVVGFEDGGLVVQFGDIRPQGGAPHSFPAKFVAWPRRSVPNRSGPG
nr:hypothetical protein KitaXyl93_04300 [Kitasatospora sp. Xyl93]